MNNIFLLFFILIFLFVGNAKRLNAQLLGSGSLPKNNTIQTFDNRFKGIKGSPYLYDHWLKGTLVTTAGDIYQDIELKYQMVEEEILIKNLKGQLVRLTKEQVSEFYIHDDAVTYAFMVFPIPNSKNQQKLMYCQIVTDGAVQILIRRRKYYVPANRDNFSYNDQTYDEYKFKKDVVYLRKKEDKMPIKYTRSRKALFQFLGSHEDELKDFIKANQLILADISDLMELINYFNELEE